MKCPVCHSTAHVVLDTHAEGFVSNLEECGDCGALWTNKWNNETVVIHCPTLAAANA